MTKRAEKRIFKCICMLSVDDFTAISGELQSLSSFDLHVDRVEMCVNREVCIAREPKNVLRPAVHIIRDRWVVANLLQKEAGTIGRGRLVSLSDDWIKWLVPVVGGLQI